MVMVVFGVMLTAKGPTGSLRIPAYETLVTLLASLLFFLVLMTSLLFSRGMPANQDGNANTFSSNITTTRLGESLMGMDWANTKGNLVSTPEITIPKQQVSYLLPFEVISVHLLIVLIGASYLARARRDSGEHDNA